MNLFDRETEIYRQEHCLPHWMQDGTITYITMRQADSLPRKILEQWENERLEFLRQQGIHGHDWRPERLS